MKQFRETGFVEVKKHMHQQNVVTPEKVDEVRERMEASPKKSRRHLVQQALLCGDDIINCVNHVTSFCNMRLHLRKILGS